MMYAEQGARTFRLTFLKYLYYFFLLWQQRGPVLLTRNNPTGACILFF